MDKLIRSLHHVTATVNDAQEDLDFYVKLLGLRASLARQPASPYLILR